MKRLHLAGVVVLLILLLCPSTPEQVLAKTPTDETTVIGRWQVKLVLSGIGEKNLVFEAQDRGDGLILLQDSKPENQPAAVKLPGAWSVIESKRFNMSGEMELQLGTCCRETGTLILKGQLVRPNSVSGKAIFVGSSEDSENVLGYRVSTGTFTATRDN